MYKYTAPIFSLLLSLPVLGSINPERIVTPLLDIMSSRIKFVDQETVKVPVTTFNQRGDLRKGKSRAEIGMEEFQEFRALASAVFRTNNEDSSNRAPGPTSGTQIFYGTAFHIGHNLVLTNAHVLDRDFRNLTSCGTFKIRDHSHRIHGCKKVHYCDKDHDICLIEMRASRHPLSSGPSLKLVTDHKEKNNFERQQALVLSAIGNSKDLGIHFSQGRGYELGRSDIRFYAPIRPGNSGGPLLNQEGFVIGVVKRESPVTVGEQAYNVATTAEKTVELLREALTHDPDTLEKFNQAVIE
jgi:S1-C subfamily serine protease